MVLHITYIYNFRDVPSSLSPLGMSFQQKVLILERKTSTPGIVFILQCKMSSSSLDFRKENISSRDSVLILERRISAPRIAWVSDEIIRSRNCVDLGISEYQVFGSINRDQLQRAFL